MQLLYRADQVLQKLIVLVAQVYERILITVR